jgi:hypothetical protein
MRLIEKLRFREAMLADRRALWDWRNDYAAFGLTTVNQDINYAAFSKWFEHALASESTLLLIGHAESVRLGIAWLFELDAECWEILVSIKPVYCGCGITSAFLRGATAHAAELRAVRDVTLNTPVLNPATTRALSDAGFEFTLNDGFVRSHLQLTR